MVRDKVIGAMAVQDYTDATYFSREDIGIMEAVCGRWPGHRAQDERGGPDEAGAANAASRSKSEFWPT